jgi:hypothetical protein
MPLFPLAPDTSRRSFEQQHFKHRRHAPERQSLRRGLIAYKRYLATYDFKRFKLTDTRSACA